MVLERPIRWQDEEDTQEELSDGLRGRQVHSEAEVDSLFWTRYVRILGRKQEEEDTDILARGQRCCIRPSCPIAAMRTAPDLITTSVVAGGISEVGDASHGSGEFNLKPHFTWSQDTPGRVGN